MAVVGPVGVVTGLVGEISGRGHWVWSVDGGYTVYLIIKCTFSSCICAFYHALILASYQFL